MPWLKLVGGVRWDVYSAQIGNSINSVNTPGNTTHAVLVADRSISPAFAPA